MTDKSPDEGFTWQVDVWGDMAEIYGTEIDERFRPIVERVIDRAGAAGRNRHGPRVGNRDSGVCGRG